MCEANAKSDHPKSQILEWGSYNTGCKHSKNRHPKLQLPVGRSSKYVRNVYF